MLALDNNNMKMWNIFEWLSQVYAFVTATGTGISSLNLVKQFYSDASFQVKVVDYLKAQETGCLNKTKA